MLSLRIPNDQEFQQIRKYIQEFELDDRVLFQTEFISGFIGDKLVGFGRLRNHSDCTELCSLGVISQYRNKEIGKIITAELIKKAEKNLYVVCIIPDFFATFGFQIVDGYPAIMKEKLEYCTCELVVPETYVVMQLKK